MSAFLFLIHAHDHVWKIKGLPLADRMEASRLIYATAFKLPPQAWIPSRLLEKNDARDQIVSR